MVGDLERRARLRDFSSRLLSTVTSGVSVDSITAAIKHYSGTCGLDRDLRFLFSITNPQSRLYAVSEQFVFFFFRGLGSRGLRRA